MRHFHEWIAPQPRHAGEREQRGETDYTIHIARAAREEHYDGRSGERRGLCRILMRDEHERPADGEERRGYPVPRSVEARDGSQEEREEDGGGVEANRAERHPPISRIEQRRGLAAQRHAADT